MSNDIELLACPFCGGSAILQEHPAHTHAVATFMPDHPGSATVECMGCNVGMINDTVAQVTADWNTRAALAAPHRDHCELYGGCVCGGDTKGVRESCVNWRKGQLIETLPAALALSDAALDCLRQIIDVMDAQFTSSWQSTDTWKTSVDKARKLLDKARS